MEAVLGAGWALNMHSLNKWRCAHEPDGQDKAPVRVFIPQLVTVVTCGRGAARRGQQGLGLVSDV